MSSLFMNAQMLAEHSIAGTFSSEDSALAAQWPLDDLPILFGAADAVRRTFHGNTVYPCALMNVKSGGCSENCAFCAQSASNDTTVTAKPLATADEIASSHAKAASADVDFCMVSSGKRLSPADIDRIVESAKKCGAPVHASLGILSPQDFVKLKDAGVVCYNHNIETSRRYFPQIVTTHTYDDRINTVKGAKAAGLGVCCGGIFGMGETWDDRIDMARELSELDVDVVPLNFLNAIPGTKVAKPLEPPREFLKIIALFRLMLPRQIIKVCGGREVNLRQLQPLMFLAGANGYVAGNYLTTAGQPVEQDNQMIADLGLVPGHEYEAVQLRLRNA